MTPLSQVTAALLVATVACAPQVADVETAHEIADRIIVEMGHEPDERRVAHRTPTPIYDLASTVLLTWVDADLGDDPAAHLEQVLTDAGLTVSILFDELPEGDPRRGGDAAEFYACADNAPSAGATLSFGPADDADGYVVMVETGGPPADSGC